MPARRQSILQAKTRRSAFASARSIEEPLRQIVENAGEDAAVELNQVKGGMGGMGGMDM